MEKRTFAVMRWLNDGNRLSVHSLKQVVEPKIPLGEFKSGMCGVSLYKGFPGLWQFRILAIGEKKEMNEWLDSRLQWLLVDATDKFCEVTKTEKRTPSKGEIKSPDLSHESTTPKKRQLESSHDLLLSTQSHSEHKKQEVTRAEKRTPRKRELKLPDSSHESLTPKKRQPESLHDLWLSRRAPSELKKNEETMSEKRTPKKRELKSPDSSRESKTPKKRQMESSHDLSLSRQSPYEHKKNKETKTEKRTPKKRELKLLDSPHESTTPKKRQMESSHDLSLSRQSPYEHKKNEESDSIGIHTSVSHLSKRTGDSSSERISRLEKTVRRLEDKIKKLSNRCDVLEGTKQVERPSNQASRRVDNEISPPNNTDKKKAQNKTATPINNTDKPEDIDDEAIETGVAKWSSDHDIFKYLCASILTPDEIINCTRTGKKTIKCTDTKPQVNQEKFSRLQDLVLKHTKLDKAAFIKKFENMQKVLRRK